MRNKLLLVLIILIAAFLRFWQLGTNPPSLTWDEVAWGYNAYSLGLDGKDEFGRFLPYDYLESFGDFKPPLYAYASVIPVKVFGITEFGTRFASAFFGTLTVLITYFLTRRIFAIKKKQVNANTIALFAAFFLAISPWHINLSRAAFEANVASFFIVCGVWLFLKAMQKNRWYLVFSAICFVLSIYTFNTARVVTPLLALGLAIGFRKQIFERKKELILSTLVGLLMILPIVQFLVSPQASLRFREVNIFSDISIIEKTNQQIENDDYAWWSKIIHNRRFTYGVEYIRHYLDHFNPYFLFIKGDGNPKFSTQDVGQMYLIELPFLIAGILYLFRKREGNWWIIPFWLLIGIIPAATARETPHALRIETTLPTFQILVAYGLVNIIRPIANIRYKVLPVGLGVVLLSLFLNFLYYFHGYHTYYPREYSGEWQYGYKESLEYAKSVEHTYDAVYLTTALGRPYIYYLFYTKTTPEKFRNDSTVRRDAFGFVTVERIGKYHFGINHDDSRNVLFIGQASQAPKNANVLRAFHLLNGKEVLVAYTL